ncbi:hypothetical protein BDV98DRAFT_636489 [Pterulicium gracile]|uniref:Uncharacterized protein n=1 Tax=Pterulicium gracile TaxID=1884261 RepID=A0A5C3QRY7_9AGAR|nr:hypothetical protein BDV98DRAFT_636489 [Pterula gracilis]
MPKQPSKTSPKRKASSPRKKAAAVVNHSAARALVEDVLVLDGDLEATLSQVLSTAAYARHLEETVRQLTPKGKTCQEIDHESDKLRKAAVSGIKKQMKWRASCKHQGSPWVYDGICPEPDVFGAMFGIEGPPTWPRKMKRFSAEEFQEFVGTIRASAQWHDLYLHDDTNVTWKQKEGTFKCIGKYGLYKEPVRVAVVASNTVPSCI